MADFTSCAATWQTGQTYALSLILATSLNYDLWPEVLDITLLSQPQVTCTVDLVKVGRVVCEIHKWTGSVVVMWLCVVVMWRCIVQWYDDSCRDIVRCQSCSQCWRLWQRCHFLPARQRYCRCRHVECLWQNGHCTAGALSLWIFMLLSRGTQAAGDSICLWLNASGHVNIQAIYV